MMMEGGLIDVLECLNGSQHSENAVAQRFWDFGIENLLADLFRIPEWTAARKMPISTIELEGWYGGADAERMNRCCRGALLAPNSSAALYTPICLGYDQGQISAFKSHSTGVVCLK